VYYIIYKTTNLINGKYYIGKHQTKDLNDGYVGSGKYLKNAIKKYGIENFETIILYVYNEEWKMNIAEKILVVIDSEVSYNLCPGGKGGFGYINKNNLNNIITDELRLKRRQAKLGKSNPRVSEKLKQSWLNGERKLNNALLEKQIAGWKHTEESKQKIKLSKSNINISGKNNPMYNKVWLFDENGNRYCFNKNSIKPDNLMTSEQYKKFKKNKKIKKEKYSFDLYKKLINRYNELRSYRKLAAEFSMNHETIRNIFKYYNNAC